MLGRIEISLLQMMCYPFDQKNTQNENNFHYGNASNTGCYIRLTFVITFDTGEAVVCCTRLRSETAPALRLHMSWQAVDTQAVIIDRNGYAPAR